MLICNRKIIFDHFCYRYFSACMFQNTSFVFINTKSCSKIWLCLRNRGTETSGEKKETALLGARNRYALRLAGHQSPRQIVRDGTAGGQLAITCYKLAIACGLGVHRNSLQIETTIFVPHRSIALRLSPLEWGILFLFYF